MIASDHFGAKIAGLIIILYGNGYMPNHLSSMCAKLQIVNVLVIRSIYLFCL